MAGNEEVKTDMLSAEDKEFLEQRRIEKEENAYIEKAKKGELGIPGEGFEEIANHPEFARLKKVAGGFNAKTAATIVKEVFTVIKNEEQAKRAAKEAAEKAKASGSGIEQKAELSAGGGGAGDGGANKQVDWKNLDKEEMAKLPPAQRMLVEGLARHRKQP